ncbi:carboxymuconolactone decarboxylase family protein [Paracoccus sp. (in: a-proteobacteria)]|uniref:carboxymuconolactone decarboxylase family protein n=1 Tax=Paracoccus sp. TaxID=267 RepID=UPI002AFDF2E9|nr:carboxymuconolactone decarboxylase family protein [Paracoccus sp. (in: a-proteobacteria)]
MDKPGSSPRMASAEIHEAAPALGWYTDQILFGQNWVDPALSPRDRSLLTCSTLISRSYFAQLVNHSKRAIANGMTPAELIELATHLTFYAGWPCGMSAVATLRDVFASQGIAWAEVAEQTVDDLPICFTSGGLVPDLAAQLAGAETLADYTGRVILNDLWQRWTLKPRDRSLATIAALVAGGDTGQLPFHVQRGLDNGLTAAELTAALTHLAFYAGWPKAMAALPVVQAACAGR